MPRAIFLANRPGDRPLRFLPKGKTALTPPFASLLHETTTAELDPNFLPEPALGSQAVESMPDELIKSADLDGFLRDVKGLDNLAVHSRMAARSTRTKGKALQILLVEDNVGDARLLYEMFSQERPDSFKLTHLMRMSEAEVHLAKGGVDIILLDMGLPDGHGLDTVKRARAAAPDVPMIVLTGLDDEELAAEAMKEGAQDYLIKGQIENRALPRAFRHAIERHRM